MKLAFGLATFLFMSAGFLASHQAGALALRSPIESKKPLLQSIAAISLMDGYKDQNVQLSKLPKSWQWNGRNAIGAPSQSFVSPVLIGDGRVLLSILGGGLQLRDLKTGNKIWSVDIPMGVASIPFVAEPFVYVVGMDAKARKIRLSSGQEIWNATLSVESTGGIVVSRGVVYATTADDSLWALEDGSGKPLWRYKRPSPTNSVYWSLRGSARPALSLDGSVIFSGFSDGAFVALDAESGRLKWERSFGNRKGRFQDADLSPVLSADGRRLIVALVDGDLLALSPENGDSLWAVSLKCASAPVLSEDGKSLFQASTDGMIYSVAPVEGRVQWKVKSSQKSSPASLGLLQGNRLAVTVFGEGFKVISAADGTELWQDNSEWNSATSAVYDGNRVLFVTSRNQLLVYRIDETTKSASPMIQ